MLAFFFGLIAFICVGGEVSKRYKFCESKYVSVVKMCGMQEKPEFRGL
jgi:hypothetical protein